MSGGNQQALLLGKQRDRHGIVEQLALTVAQQAAAGASGGLGAGLQLGGIRIARDFVEAVQPPWYTLIQRRHQDVRKAGNTAVRRGWCVRLSVKCIFSVIVKSPHVVL